MNHTVWIVLSRIQFRRFDRRRIAGERIGRSDIELWKFLLLRARACRNRGKLSRIRRRGAVAFLAGRRGRLRNDKHRAARRALRLHARVGRVAFEQVSLRTCELKSHSLSYL